MSEISNECWEISNVCMNDMWSYLMVHEEDIARNENDFGNLLNVFKEVAGRDPVVEE